MTAFKHSALDQSLTTPRDSDHLTFFLGASQTSSLDMCPPRCEPGERRPRHYPSKLQRTWHLWFLPPLDDLKR